MYPVSEEYKTAIERGDIQRIWGKLVDVYGRETALDDSNMVGLPAIDRRCVEDEEVFMVGQLYTGELSLELRLEGIRRDELIGGEVRLWFGVGAAADEVPLGVWDISSAERENADILSIKALDHINRLSVKTNDTRVGAVTVAASMALVEQTANVTFAQSIGELRELMPVDSYGNRLDLGYGCMATHFLETCRDEVAAIAQLLGGFAFADREGKIRFGRFGRSPVRSIPAELRKSARLSEYNYGVHSFSYTDSRGRTVTEPCTSGQSSAILNICDNKYMQYSGESYKEHYDRLLYPLCAYFSGLRWVPGTIEYYGDPALDLGDMVTVEGGINGSGSSKFLICSDFWQFRSPQQLTAPGAPREGSSTVTSTGSSTGAAAYSATINITQSIEAAELCEYPQTADISTTVADGEVSARDETQAFFHCLLQLLGAEDCTASVSAFLDGEEVLFPSAVSVKAGEYVTLERTLPVRLSAGTHFVSAELEAGRSQLLDGAGTALLDSEDTALYPENSSSVIKITGVSAHVWGQNIVPDKEGSYGVSYIQTELEELVENVSPPTLSRLLAALSQQRVRLAQILREKGEETEDSESFNSLIDKTDALDTGSAAAETTYIQCIAVGNGIIGKLEKTEV